MAKIGGEGRPHQNAGGAWTQWIDLGLDENGKRKRKRISRKTRAEVKAAVAELRQKQADGILIDAEPIKFGKFLDIWLNEAISRDTRPHTYLAYQNAIKNIASQIGHKQLDKLTRADLNGVLQVLAETLAVGSLKICRTVMRQALEAAFDKNIISKNPGIRLKLPNSARKGGLKKKVFHYDQAQALIDASQHERLGLALRIAIALGLRRGEVLGLRLADLELDGPRPSLTVAGQVIYDPGQPISWSFTKTHTVRTILLPPALVDDIKIYLHQRAKEQAAKKWKDSPYLFRAEQHGGLVMPTLLYTAFKRAAKRANLPPDWRLHDLRHYCATFLAAQQVPIEVISRVLGHANANITRLIYRELFDGELDDVTKHMQLLLVSSLTSPDAENRKDS